jgi:hypothetical protein
MNAVAPKEALRRMELSDEVEEELREYEESIRTSLTCAQTEAVPAMSRLFACMRAQGDPDAASDALTRRPNVAHLVFDKCCCQRARMNTQALQLVEGILLLDQSKRTSRALARDNAVQKCLAMAEDSGDNMSARRAALNVLIVHIAYCTEAQFQAEQCNAMQRLAALTATESGIQQHAYATVHLLAGFLKAIGSEEVLKLRKALEGELHQQQGLMHIASVLMGDPLPENERREGEADDADVVSTNVANVTAELLPTSC